MEHDRKKRGGRRWRNAVMGILAAAVVISGILLLLEQMESARKREEQERLTQLASQPAENLVIETEPETETVPEETEAEYISPIDFEALWEINPDVVGWITIPDTQINYPILYDPEDNQKYLHTDMEGKESVYGSIYLDSDSDPDFRGYNHPIYGHHMKDGSMFKDVVRFKDETFFRQHQYFEIYTPDRTIHLKAVSCYYSDSNGIVRKTAFRSQEDFDAWMKERLEPCSYAEIPEVSVGSVFVLVTCSYETNDARTLLFAVEVDEDGSVIPAE
jgi:sortase B